MAKLTKMEIKNHEKATELLKKDILTHEEKIFIFKNYQESATNINSKAGAFFTPFGLANDFTLNIPYKYKSSIKIIDLCAGIGILSYAAYISGLEWDVETRPEVTCVELNPKYVEIGKKILPQAKWICADVLDPELLNKIGYFDCAISNPPFGNIKSPFKDFYTYKNFEYMVIEAAASIADYGAFIIPQMSAPFVYSGTKYSKWLDSECKAKKFEKKTGIDLEFGAGIDTYFYKEQWHGVSPTCEIVCCDFKKENEEAL